MLLEAPVQALPFQCRMVESPTAQTSFAALPQTPARSFVVSLETMDQPLPFQCRTAPPAPTAQTSFAPCPQTPERLFPVGGGSPLQTWVAAKFWLVTFPPFTVTAKPGGLKL